MKLYNSIGPNPHVVRMFMAERGIELETIDIDVVAGDSRQADHLARNPAGQSPCLQLDDGTWLAEITAICEYLDEKFPGPALLGASAEERAKARMWVRRVDLNILEPLANGFRFSEGLPMFKDRIRTIPEAADGLKTTARERLRWLDGLMTGEFVGGDHIGLADIMLYCFLTFGKQVGQPYDEGLAHIHGWYQRMSARPSATA